MHHSQGELEEQKCSELCSHKTEVSNLRLRGNSQQSLDRNKTQSSCCECIREKRQKDLLIPGRFLNG